MYRTWMIVLTIFMAYSATFACGQDDQAQSTLVKVGAAAPVFRCETIDGKGFDLAEQKGKVVLVTFFATWCGPCLDELPHLEKEVYKVYKDHPEFTMIVVGREHSAQELKTFQKERGFAFPFVPDPKREIYGKYAEKYIPRNVLVGKDGTVKLTTVGFTDEGLKELVEKIKEEMAK